MGCWRHDGGPLPPGARLIRPHDGEYPALPEGVDPPVPRLWLLGADLRDLPPLVAVVGTRRPTPYGLEVAERIAHDLARAGLGVVSGMALGVDTAAHVGALRGGGTTVAVLGSGVDVPYPAENSPLYDRIAAEGSILTEVPPGAEPRREHFPQRNRIIAALAHALVFVQGRAGRSGAMKTAGFAHDYDREVFAVPGDVRAAMSTGPHAVLREGWGSICTDATDVLDVVGPRLGWRTVGTLDVVIPPGLSPERRAALVAVAEGSGDVASVARNAGLDLRDALRALGGLELAGSIRRNAAGAFEPAIDRPEDQEERRTRRGP